MGGEPWIEGAQGLLFRPQTELRRLSSRHARRTGSPHHQRGENDMAITIGLASETEEKLRARASESGVDVSVSAGQLTEKEVQRLWLSEVLAPFRRQVRESGRRTGHGGCSALAGRGSRGCMLPLSPKMYSTPHGTTVSPSLPPRIRWGTSGRLTSTVQNSAPRGRGAAPTRAWSSRSRCGSGRLPSPPRARAMRGSSEAPQARVDLELIARFPFGLGCLIG